MEAILYFTSGFSIAATLAMAVRSVERGREHQRVLDATSSWGADLYRKMRWPSDAEARRAMQP